MKSFTLFAWLSALSAGVLPITTSAAGLYQITPLGLSDTQHTRNNGYRSNNVIALSDGGRVAGNARRFNGGGAD
ncbi:MAG: hypothetical protein MUF81_13600, partial [Verrucomicrobia bacterium]|nr:hypothetical protein [Verrucomicrobiota bacterium]